VFGIRKSLREFLNLWAIGSMVGSTQTVDMKTTRKNNFGRILVAVLDPNLVPAKLDVVIGDHYFELRFVKEHTGFDENGDEAEMNFQDGDDKDDASMEEEEGNDDQNFPRNAKRAKGDDLIIETSGNMSCSDGGAKASMAVRTEGLEDRIQRLADEIIDMAVNSSVDKCCDLVLAEVDEEAFDGRMEETDLVDVAGAPMVAVAQKGQAEVLHPEAQPSSLGVSPVPAACRGMGLGILKPQLASPVTTPIAAASIKEALTTPTRSSPRLAGALEEHVMDKARKRAALKNLEPIEGNISNPSFPSFSDIVIHSELSKIGVSLGKNSSEISDSLKRLRSLEAKRLTSVSPSKAMENPRHIALLDDEEDEDLDNTTLGHLCGNLMDEVLDEDSDHLSCDFQVVFKKNKLQSSSKRKKISKIKMARKNKSVSP
jgi:hypothetical protein